MQVETGRLRTFLSARGIRSYEIELSHKELHKHRIIKGNDQDFVTREANLQAAEWNEQWNKKVAAEQRISATNNKKQLAVDKNRDAQNLIGELNHPLHYTNDTIDWESLKNYSPFPVTRPVQKKYPVRCYFQFPLNRAVPTKSINLNLVFSTELFQTDLTQWRKTKADLDEKNNTANRAHAEQ